MPTPTSLKVEDIPTTDPVKFIRTTLMFFKHRNPGIVLNVQPIELKNNMWSFVMLTHKNVLLEPRERHSFPALRHWADCIKNDPRYTATVRQICEQEGLTLVAEEAKAA